MRPFIAGCLLALAACSTVSQPPRELPKEPIRDTLIVPYIRIGPAALGMTEAQMLQWLGEPTQTIGLGTESPDYTYEDGPGGWRYAINFEKGRAYRISTTMRQYQTSEGIGVGSTDLKTRVTLGHPVKQETLNRCGGAACEERVPFLVKMCFKNGVEMHVNVDTSKVSSVLISNKGCSISR